MIKRAILLSVMLTVAAITFQAQAAHAQGSGLGEAIDIINSQQEKISSLETKNANLSRAVLQLQDEIKRLEKQNTKLAGSASGSTINADETLRMENNTLKTENYSLRKDNEELLKRIGVLRDDIKRLEGEVKAGKPGAATIAPEAKSFNKDSGAKASASEAGAVAVDSDSAENTKTPRRKILSLTMDQWNADLSSGGDNLDQKFFPAVKALVSIKDYWSLDITSMSGDEAREPGVRISTQVTGFGVRFHTKSGLYYSLTKHSVEYDVLFTTPLAGALTGGTIDVNGIRLAAGKLFPLSGPWSANAELGYGINTDADVTATALAGGASAEMDADEMDYDLTFIYKKSPDSLQGRVGYRAINTGISSLSGSEDLKLKGLYFGLGYDF